MPVPTISETARFFRPAGELCRGPAGLELGQLQVSRHHLGPASDPQLAWASGCSNKLQQHWSSSGKSWADGTNVWGNNWLERIDRLNSQLCRHLWERLHASVRGGSSCCLGLRFQTKVNCWLQDRILIIYGFVEAQLLTSLGCDFGHRSQSLLWCQVLPAQSRAHPVAPRSRQRRWKHGFHVWAGGGHSTCVAPDCQQVLPTCLLSGRLRISAVVAV